MKTQENPAAVSFVGSDIKLDTNSVGVDGAADDVPVGTAMKHPLDVDGAAAGPAELYQALKQYSAKVRRDHRLQVPPADSVTVYSPLCGSRLELDASFDDGHVRELGYKVRACSLGQAVTAIVAQRAPGLDEETLRQIGGQLRAILAGESDHCEWPELEMFALIRDVPARHGAALLPFQALDLLFERASSGGGRIVTDSVHSSTFPEGNEP